jgi:hypothetical protein
MTILRFHKRQFYGSIKDNFQVSFRMLRSVNIPFPQVDRHAKSMHDEIVNSDGRLNLHNVPAELPAVKTLDRLKQRILVEQQEVRGN